jgi:hypothetical protein
MVTENRGPVNPWFESQPFLDPAPPRRDVEPLRDAANDRRTLSP